MAQIYSKGMSSVCSEKVSEIRKNGLSPQCLSPNAIHFLGADYRYYPCCFLRSGEELKQLKKRLDDNDLNELSIKSYDLPEIMNSTTWTKILETFTKKPMDVCKRMCPSDKKLENREKRVEAN